MMVQELGWDDDVDEDLCRRIEDILGDELVDDTFGERVAVVLLWWRSGDGDLADELITARTVLSGTGFVWLMTPKPARPDHVDAAEVSEAADLAGLHVTSRIDRRDWLGTEAHPVQLTHPTGTVVLGAAARLVTGTGELAG
ncbi:DUF3052 domain-containing protein [Rhodococcus wratislaviensis]|uniref:DUF3052 domain-containing protein n=1 Tax=Rhodococcus wratislaviensis TaxID=44752 RepID=UPI0021F20DC0|nr:DUF3052 domain-containing protein [Rhodococcus wratislaviensis]